MGCTSGCGTTSSRFAVEIKALRCACGPETIHPPDHYDSGACANPDRDLDWMYIIQNILTGDKLHTEGHVTATRMSRCPRAIAIGDYLPVTLDLMDFNEVTWGTAMHAFMEQRGRPGQHKEVRFPFEGQPAPIILGRPVHGMVDLVSPDTVLLKDYKFHGAWAQWFADQDRQVGIIKPELSAQFSVYKIALEKLLPGTHITKAKVVHAAMGVGRGSRPPFDAPSWMTVEVPFFTEEELGAFKPLGGRWTVLETLAMLEEFIASARDEEAVRKIPMVGRERGWKNKKGFTPECDYCAVRFDCEKIEGIAPV